MNDVGPAVGYLQPERLRPTRMHGALDCRPQAVSELREPGVCDG
ncbi:hypothetical protein [Kibdelosporangium philippinense]